MARKNLMISDKLYDLALRKFDNQKKTGEADFNFWLRKILAEKLRSLK